MATVSLLPPRSEPSGVDAPPSLRRRAVMVRLVRYAGVSAVATTTSLVVLFVMVGMVRLPAVWSNVAATAVGTVPSFELNRRWVWGRSGRRSLMGQIVPFAVLSFTGLLVSTVAVGLVSGRTTGWSHWGHTVAVESANVAAYGSLWVAQYVLLDRVLFRSRGGEAAESDHGTEPTGPSPLTADRQTTPSWAGPVDSIVVSGARRPRAHDPRRE